MREKRAKPPPTLGGVRAGVPSWFFPFRLRRLRYYTAPHRWGWQHSRHAPRSWNLIRAQQFQALRAIQESRRHD